MMKQQLEAYVPLSSHTYSNCYSDTLKYHMFALTHLFTSYAQGCFLYYMNMLQKPVLHLNLYPRHLSNYTRLILVS